MSAKPGRRVKILVIYENGAGGHRGLALAIVEALKDYPDVDATSLELDTLAPKSRKKMYTFFMDIRPYFRRIVGFGFLFSMRPNPVFSIWRAVEAFVQPISLRRFLDVVKAERPDLLVSTHFRPNLACDGWIKSGQLRVPVHAAVVDYLAHGLYARDGISRFYVATEEVKEDLVRQGVGPERVLVTGIPVSLTMVRPDGRSREQLRADLGLLPDVPAMLIMGGARGDQDYGALLRALHKRGTRAQIVVLCGWNKALKAEVEGIAAGLDLRVHVKGFQGNMADWYRAVDMIMTKPGGMTSTEALVMGKPIVIISPHPGKEEAQAERLARAGVAIYEQTPDSAVEAALRVLHDPAEQRRMEARVARFARPDAAQRIAKELVAAAYQAAGAAVPEALRASGS